MKLNKILTLDIGASKISVQFVDEQGNFEPINFVSLKEIDFDDKSFINFLVENLKSHIASRDDYNIIALAVAAPGPVDSEKGIIKNMPNIKNIDYVEIKKNLENILNLPVFLLNDADAGCLGEWWLGSGKGFKNILYLTLSTGLGSGVIKDNELRQGAELGHTKLKIDNEERKCNCGNQNCAESFLGTDGLAETYANIFDVVFEDMDINYRHAISPRMRVGVTAKDEKWLKLQEKYAQELAIFIDTQLQTQRPEIIILGGGIAFGNEELLKKVKGKLNTNINIVLAKFKNSVNLGAAKYTLDKMNVK